MADNGYTPDGFCPKCGYQMSPGRCPECGTEVSVATLESIPPAQRRRDRRDWRIVGALTILPLAVLFVTFTPACVFMVWRGWENRSQEHANRFGFDAVAWRDAARVQNGVRIRMVDDLLAKHPLQDLNRQEVLDLLGPRDNTSHYSGWALEYWLGQRSFSPGCDEWLVVNFDDSGRVSNYRLEKQCY